MRLHIIALGGTIASTGERGQNTVPRLGADELVQAVPGLSDLGEISTETLFTKPSGDLRVDDVVQLSQHITSLHERGECDAVVVTQGTDTIEETSFALSLLVDPALPVAVTGAMRNPSLPGADGPANLLAAAQVATSRRTAGLGAVVVLNDEVHAARYVSKRHTASPSTFSSYPWGPIGAVTEGSAVLGLTPPAPPTFTIDSEGHLPDVALVPFVLGDTGRFVQSLRADPPDGCVIAAYGGGHVPGWLAEDVGALAKHVPTVLSSRTGGGSTLRQTYGFPGSERDLLSKGLIHGGGLSPLKARILLIVLLASGHGTEASITGKFATY